MRDEDVDETMAVAERHNELRDIHHRIDSLKEENERQYTSLAEKLHSLELAVARGARFPAGAWVAAGMLFLSVIGSSGVLYAELQTAKHDSSKALALVEKHLENAPTHRAAVERLDDEVAVLLPKMTALDERVKTLEGKVVGEGQNGWHRRDHDLYARMIDERNDRIRSRLDIIEAKQAELCTRLRECKAGK